VYMLCLGLERFTNDKFLINFSLLRV